MASPAAFGLMLPMKHENHGREQLWYREKIWRFSGKRKIRVVTRFIVSAPGTPILCSLGHTDACSDNDGYSDNFADGKDNDSARLAKPYVKNNRSVSPCVFCR